MVITVNNLSGKTILERLLVVRNAARGAGYALRPYKTNEIVHMKSEKLPDVELLFEGITSLIK